MSIRNRWLLGKLSFQVRHSTGGCVWSLGLLYEFTNVYRTAQQENGRLGGGENQKLARRAWGAPDGKVCLWAFRTPLYEMSRIGSCKETGSGLVVL